MKTLTLPLKREYFEAIRDGRKKEEYRKLTPYWTRRLKGKSFGRVVLTLGYPKKDDESRRLVRPWRGYDVRKIKHDLFGDDAVWCYVIKV
jgi:hypothetical protein